MPLLEDDEVRAVVDAAIECGLAHRDIRPLLFADLDPRVMAALSEISRPDAQVNHDVRALDALEASHVGDDFDPLTTWLTNAYSNAGLKPEREVFAQTRALLPARKLALPRGARGALGRQRAPRPDWIDLELTVDAAGWSAALDELRWRVDDAVAGAGGDAALGEQIAWLRREGNRALPTDPRGAPLAMVAGSAAQVRRVAGAVGERLTGALLSSEARARVEGAIAARTGQTPPCLRLRVRASSPDEVARADHALALPWELLRVGGRFPVEDGALDVAREAVVAGAPSPGPPELPLTVVATVAAPVGATPLDYEDECYRLWTALGDEDRRLLLTDRGTVDELVEAVATLRPPVVHFTGHGGPGVLCFEDDAARVDEVGVDELVARLRRGVEVALPRLVFVAACHGASVGPGRAGGDGAGARAAEAPKMTDPAAEAPGVSVAASLNRAGFADVVGYFGPVGDAQSTRIEGAFYAALVGGATARAAVRAGRAVAATPLGPAGARTHVYPLGWAQLALYHRGDDRPVATTRVAGAVDVHRGRRRVERRLDRAGQTDDGVVHLRHGFIGRRSPRAELIRRWSDGARRLVVYGLGGLGKTALCGEVAPIVARRMGGVPILALDGTAARGRARPVEALWAELGAFEPGGEWDRAGWEAALAGFQKDGLTGAGLARAILDAARRCGGLLVYLDDTESLLIQDGERWVWVDDEARALWETLGAACAPGGRLGVLASSRYVPEGTPRAARVPLPAMKRADVARMLRWMPTLGRLGHVDAAWLAERVDGHPRTVQWLDALAGLRADAVAGERIGPDAAYDGRDWRGEVLTPALGEVGAEVDGDLLLPRLYDALPEATRAHLGACTVLSRAVPWGAVVALGTVASATTLVEMGLLSPDVLADADARWWAPHGLVRAAVAPRWAGDAKAAHGVVGRWLAAAFEREPAGAVLLPAIEHLLAAGEADAAWPLVQRRVLALRHAGRYREALAPVEAALAAGPTGEARGMALTYRVQLARLAGVTVADPVGDLEAAAALVGERAPGVVLDELGAWHHSRGQLI
ncbi:MAG: CHAT domain-containing protein, partial [bacterium]